MLLLHEGGLQRLRAGVVQPPRVRAEGPPRHRDQTPRASNGPRPAVRWGEEPARATLKHGVVQPPCVYAEGPSIILHVIKNPKFFRTQKHHVGKGLGRGPECGFPAPGGWMVLRASTHPRSADGQHPFA